MFSSARKTDADHEQNEPCLHPYPQNLDTFKQPSRFNATKDSPLHQIPQRTRKQFMLTTVAEEISGTLVREEEKIRSQFWSSKG